ncbi:MAG: DUF5009 domain-containing protein [Verrucomicrobiales bacterium]|nr:DUF5009 domain-containing protein [Verrucomicrobiales bacterium]
MDPTKRLVSLDAFRGFVMLLMISAGFGIPEMAKQAVGSDPDSIWQTLAPLFQHVPWIGCAPWDMIQPSFMFMVGVAMPFSYLKRRMRGEGFWSMSWHALTRAVLLVLLAVVLSTPASATQTTWVFTNVLAQIGLGYFFLFLLWRLGPEYEISAILVIVVGYWAYFYTFTPVDDLASLKLAAEPGTQLTGFMAPWSKHINAGADFDRWFLNLLPRSTPFVVNAGGYVTLNFVPALATMLMGSLTGRFLMRSEKGTKGRVVTLVVAGLLLVAVGVAAGYTVCPVVKRIWTPSWTLFSGGLVLILLAAFYLVVEGFGWRWLVMPFVVVGMNSIFAYVVDLMAQRGIWERLQPHLPDAWLETEYLPIIHHCGVLLVIWLLCFWLYRQRAFLRL